MTWNASSLGVSRKLGYRPNGLARVVVRDELAIEQQLRLERDEFVRSDWTRVSEGVEAARAQLFGGDGADGR